MIGPNGAGKSTCFNMINGQLTPDSGQILFAGRDIAGLKAREVWRLGVGRTFQVAATFGSMTVAENVQMALISHALQTYHLWQPASKLHCGRALDLLAQVGMEAVTLADRVLVCTRRPATVALEQRIALKRPRDVLNVRFTNEFKELYDALWERLRVEYHEERI